MIFCSRQKKKYVCPLKFTKNQTFSYCYYPDFLQEKQPAEPNQTNENFLKIIFVQKII